MKTKTVKIETRTIQTNTKIVQETPEFGMSEGVRRSFGLSKFGYFLWKRRMKKLWKENSN